MVADPMTTGEDRYISLHPGTVIADRYEVVKCLGAGSMGLVYACRHKELSDHLVAVKVLFPEVARDATAAARFKNEIFASYDVSHPNVVRAYEYLRDGDLVAYTMEFVGGGDLAQQLESGHPLPIDRTVEILCQMCAGVQAIHDAGIVHRDLKPENILLTKDGIVKIADFGIARTGYGPKLTEHGGVVGTIDYVSPEYMLNSQVDWRSDIYAMGVLAFEMLTGRLPFKADSVYAAMTQRLKTDPPAPSTFNPDCTPELDRIVLKALSRDVETRFQSAAEMFMSLEPLLAADAIVPSGAFMQVNRQRSSSYRGPAVKSNIANAVTELKSQSVIYNDPDSRVATTEISSIEDLRSGGYQSKATSEPRSSAATQIISSSASMQPGMFPSSSKPQVVKVSDYYTEKDEKPVDRRSMKSIASKAPKSAASLRLDPEPARFLPPTDDRSGSSLGKISEIRTRLNFSIWVEVVTLIVAALVGIGLGFFLLKTYFPELLGL